jgi:hypothetical protein
MAQTTTVAADQHNHLQTWTEKSVAREAKHNCHFTAEQDISAWRTCTQHLQEL